jgi:hypothetical protein
VRIVSHRATRDKDGNLHPQAQAARRNHDRDLDDDREGEDRCRDDEWRCF